MWKQVVIVLVLLSLSQAFIEKLAKRFATIKALESCFGEAGMQRLLDDTTKATEKCAGGHAGDLQLHFPLFQDVRFPPPTPSFFGYDTVSYNPYYSVGRFPSSYLGNVLHTSSKYLPHSWGYLVHRQKRTPDDTDDAQEYLKDIQQRFTAKLGNVTCALQEFGYINQDMEIDLEGIKARFQAMPLNVQLRSDIYDGLDLCMDFVNCLPPKKFQKNPIMKKFGKLLVFVKCVKMQNIEACIKKDLRQKFSMVFGSLSEELINRPDLGLPEDKGEAALYLMTIMLEGLPEGASAISDLVYDY